MIDAVQLSLQQDANQNEKDQKEAKIEKMITYIFGLCIQSSSFNLTLGVH